MNRLRNLSIQNRLITLAAFVITGMICLYLTGNFSSERIGTLYQTQLVISKIDTVMLTLRRNEKDFMARKDSKYIDKFNGNFQQLMAKSEQLRDLLDEAGLDSAEVEPLKTVFQNYQTIFVEYAAAMEKLGFDPKSGLYGSLRAAVHNAETILKKQKQIQLTADMLMLRRREKDFMLRNDLSYLDKYQKDFGKFEQTLSTSSLESEVRQDIKLAMQQYKTNFVALVEGNVELGLSSKEGLHGEMRNIIHQSEAFLEEFDSHMLETIQNETDNIRFLQLILSVILIGTTLGMVLLLIPSISRPIRNMSALMLRTSNDWDVTVRADESVASEISEMAISFNLMMEAFGQIIASVKGSSSRLSESATSMISATEVMDNGVSRQQSEIENLEGAVNEMASAIQNVATNAASAADAAVKADEDGKIGLEVIDKTKAGINLLANEINNTARIVGELSKESENIGTVLSVIQGIAEQTNLLALNAAIEAARAGEQGRGFAVVADEVRTLAQRSQESTEEIRTIVERLQAVAESAVVAMDKSKQGTEINIEQSSQAVDSLRSIIQGISSIKDMNLSIASASEQQAAVSSEINNSIAGINEVTSETAQNSQDTLQAGKSINKLSDEMKKSVQKFNLG